MNWSKILVRRYVSAADLHPQISSSSSSSSSRCHLPPTLSHDHQAPSPSSKTRLPPPVPLRQLLLDHKSSGEHPGSQRWPAFSVPQPSYVEDSAFDDIFRRYFGSDRINHPESLHIELVKKGFLGDLFLSNKLVNLYAKASELLSAREVFDQMPEKNAVSWTCLIAGYTQQGLHDEAFQLFRFMISRGTEPTQFTYGSVLRACQDSGLDRLSLADQIHGRIAKTHYAADTTVCNALISMYGGCCLDSASNAQHVFDHTFDKSSITWNAIISVYSLRGDAFSAFEILSAMQMENGELCFRPNEFTYGSLITATYSCSSGGCLLEQMLGSVFKSGYASDLFVGSALVSAFARFGLLDEAKKIFFQMGERNAVSMNGLMVGLVKQNLGEEAVQVFREARDLVAKNSDSYVVLLSALADFIELEEGWKKGREVHGHLISTGFVDSKPAIANGLINMYARCGAIHDACNVFNNMNVKDQVSWNTLIAGFDQNGLFEETLRSFSLMQRSYTTPSNFSLISTLSSCASLSNTIAGEQVHCLGIKLGLDIDISVSNSLMTMYGQCGSLSECSKVFRWMPRYDQISWNCMIGAFSSNEATLAESIGTFLDMMRRGWQPNRVTFVNVLAALSPLSVSEMSEQVHGAMLKHGMSKDITVENALLSCYAKSGEMDLCERVFQKMADRRNNISWNTMISGYIQNGFLQKSMDVVWLMMHNGQKMDSFTFASVLNACASVAALERGMEIHAYGIRSYMEADVVVDSALVDMYSKCGRIDYASGVFRSMSMKNEFSWNSMISGYARHGLGNEALKLYDKMQARSQRPDHVTFVGVLSACSHAGLVEEGLDYFESMKSHGLVPRIEHYSCVVDLLARAGKVDQMEDFINKMPMEPNILIWRTVLVACRRSKGGEEKYIGRQASKMLLELEPQNPVNHVLISNLYASKGRWEEVAKARASLRGIPAKKEAGCSWVTLQDGVHVFVAGDRSHPDTEKIYSKLQLLILRMKDAGYVPQAEFALYDLDVENKEELLSYHSEKLAIAFVLTRPSGVPIRIMKNLRTCGDCHTAICYISKIVGRKIILRDSNRFHHFEDGSCSCGDYW